MLGLNAVIATSAQGETLIISHAHNSQELSNMDRKIIGHSNDSIILLVPCICVSKQSTSLLGARFFLYIFI